jgi:hypothetical protein
MTPIIGDLIQSGVNLFKTYFPPDLTPEQKAQLELGSQEFRKSITTSMISYSETVLEQQASVVRAEAQSEGITSKWRPITMLVFVAIIANNYIIYPYLSLFWEAAPTLEVPKDLWDLLKIGLGGYVVGRSVEKSAKNYKK